MLNEGLMTYVLKARRTLVKSWLCPILVCEQDKVDSWKGLVLHSKVAMKGLVIGKKRLQHNIVDLSLAFQLIQTDETFTVNVHKHTHARNKQLKCKDLLQIWAIIGSSS